MLYSRSQITNYFRQQTTLKIKDEKKMQKDQSYSTTLVLQTF